MSTFVYNQRGFCYSALNEDDNVDFLDYPSLLLLKLTTVM